PALGSHPQPLLPQSSGECVPRFWLYLLKDGSADLATEGRPHMRTELFLAKCPDTILVQETDTGYQRILLYGKSAQPPQT
uniref:Apolipoprotein M n=1 Tax=Sphenodon punctatus TaxID=8508 RepID=A0A8D0H017_SPHPU